MDTIIYIDGIDYLRWTDEDGNTWTARKDEVEWYGKECFEQMPAPEDNLGSWSVEFDDKNLIEMTDEEVEEYAIMEHDLTNPAYLSWLRDQEIM